MKQIILGAFAVAIKLAIAQRLPPETRLAPMDVIPPSLLPPTPPPVAPK